MDKQAVIEVGEALARELAEIVPEKRTKRWRYPNDLKARMLEYAKECRESGESIEGIAARLGLIGATLARWLRRDRRVPAGGFRSVAIIPSEKLKEEHPHPDSASIRLVTPGGYRFEGLDADAVAYLLRVLR